MGVIQPKRFATMELPTKLTRRSRPVAHAPQPPSHFGPRRIAHNGHLQTMLGTRQARDVIVRGLDQPVLLAAGPDRTGAAPDQPVRLVGYFTPALTSCGSRGMVLLVHGWEGHSHSPGILTVTDVLARAGYDVFRLNLRDHGPDLHVNRLALNRGIFLGTLGDETAAAARSAALLARGKPVHIVGGSMGGSFALRLALAHAEEPIPNLQSVIAVCPAVNPSRDTRAIDRLQPYRSYFRRRWLRSLLQKAALFPDLYDLNPMRELHGIYEMTEWIIPRYSPYADAEDYFNHYRVLPSDYERIGVKTTVIAAEDDFVIPVQDFYEIPKLPLVDVRIYRTGGHMGFVDILPYRQWLPRAVLDLLRTA